MISSRMSKARYSRLFVFIYFECLFVCFFQFEWNYIKHNLYVFTTATLRHWFKKFFRILKRVAQEVQQRLVYFNWKHFRRMSNAFSDEWNIYFFVLFFYFVFLFIKIFSQYEPVIRITTKKNRKFCYFSTFFFSNFFSLSLSRHTLFVCLVDCVKKSKRE